MHKRLFTLGTSLALIIASCGQTPDQSAQVASSDSLTITQGPAAKPVSTREPVLRPLSSVSSASSSAGGSSTSPVSVDGCANGATQTVNVRFTITGAQEGTASFQVFPTYTYKGTSWEGDGTPVTITVPGPRTKNTDPYTTPNIPVTLQNGAANATGTSVVTVAPFNVTNTNDKGAKLDLKDKQDATIHVSFNACNTQVVNEEPTITVPTFSSSIEATGPETEVPFVVTATDAEDGDLSSSVECLLNGNVVTSPLSLVPGTHTITCSVTDSGGKTAQEDFTVTVVDTTPPAFDGVPTANPLVLLADDKYGATVDVSGITAADLVDGPVTVNCGPLLFDVGSGGTVTCTATDAAGNVGTASFNVSVTLGNIGQNLLSPFNTNGTTGVKLGSTVPVKFLPPMYAGGAAVDLEHDLTLVVTRLGSSTATTDSLLTDVSTGSTVWRYDGMVAPDGQYVFNLSTKNAWFGSTAAQYRVDVKFKGLTLATGIFNTKR